MSTLGPIQGNKGLLSPTQAPASSWYNPRGWSSWFGGNSNTGGTTVKAPASGVTDKTIQPAETGATAQPTAAKSTWMTLVPWKWGGTTAPGATSSPGETHNTIDPGKTEKIGVSGKPSTSAGMYHTVERKGYLWNTQETVFNPEYSRFACNKVNTTAVEGVVKQYRPKTDLWDYQSKLSGVGLESSEIGTVFEQTVDLSKINEDNRKWFVSNYSNVAKSKAQKWMETDKNSIAAATMLNSCLSQEISRLSRQISDLQSQVSRMTSENKGLSKRLGMTPKSSAVRPSVIPSSAAGDITSTIVPGSE